MRDRRATRLLLRNGVSQHELEDVNEHASDGDVDADSLDSDRLVAMIPDVTDLVTEAQQEAEEDQYEAEREQDREDVRTDGDDPEEPEPGVAAPVLEGGRPSIDVGADQRQDISRDPRAVAWAATSAIARNAPAPPIIQSSRLEIPKPRRVACRSIICIPDR